MRNSMIYTVTWINIDDDDQYEIESFDYEDEALDFAKELRD